MTVAIINFGRQKVFVYGGVARGVGALRQIDKAMFDKELAMFCIRAPLPAHFWRHVGALLLVLVWAGFGLRYPDMHGAWEQ